MEVKVEVEVEWSGGGVEWSGVEVEGSGVGSVWVYTDGVRCACLLCCLASFWRRFLRPIHAGSRRRICRSVISPERCRWPAPNDPASQRTLLISIFIGGLLYVPLCLFEIRMSPQLHKLVYGFHQHIFAQTFRFEGWRPTVFLQHGLAVV